MRKGINGAISSIENIINKGIRLINGAIGLINKIPGVNIGKLSELKLPRLAKGGVVDKATLAEIGENGAEAVVPLAKNKQWIRAVANDMLRELQSIPGLSMGGNTSNQSEYNFTQIINAPKQPSRIELYRQTRNLLEYAKEAGGV